MYSSFFVSFERTDGKFTWKIALSANGIFLTKTSFFPEGRVFNVPILVEVPKRVKFIDIASGFDHTILLAENGDVYSMGMGT